MRKLVFVFFIGCLLSPVLHSQVLLKTQLPASGLTLKSQLWNLMLINTSAQSLNIKVEMSLTNIANSQKIMSGVSKEFILPRGAFQITPVNASPVSYNILIPQSNLSVSQEGFLPVGLFNVCYTVVALNHNLYQSLAEECETIQIEPVSPPLLLSPSDHEVSDASRPFFSWLPPNPVILFNNLSYDFSLVEVGKTQTPADAIQQNLPLYSRQNIAQTNLQYPLSLPELDTSKLYAWRIAARSGLSPIANSEVWAFSIGTQVEKREQHAGADYYTKLGREMGASSAICYGTLRFGYNNELNDNMVSVRIVDITNAKQKAIPIDSSLMTVVYGENFKEIDLINQNICKEKHVYLLQLENSREERWYLKFEYRKPLSKL